MLRAILALLFIGIVGSAIFPSKVVEPAPLSEEARLAKVAKDAQDARLLVAMRAGRTIKNSLRDPESLKFQTIAANDDASVVCYIYRAKNGFGGMNLEHAVLVGDKISNSPKIWKKNCSAEQLHDVTNARAGI